MVKIRSKKTEDGKVVRYPIMGYSKKEAQDIANRIREAYPGESVRVMSLGKGKDMFAPFIAYIGERMKRTLPLDPGDVYRSEVAERPSEPVKYSWFSPLPPLTFRILAKQITDGNPVFAVMNGASQDGERVVKGDVTIFGSSSDGSLSYVIEWPHQSELEDAAVGMYSGSTEGILPDRAQATAIRSQVFNRLEQIRSIHKYNVFMRPEESYRLQDFLHRLPDNDLVGVLVSGNRLTLYPVTHGTETISVPVEERGKLGEVRTFVKASSLAGFFQMLGSATDTGIMMGVGESEPLYGQATLNPSEDGASARNMGNLQVIASPFEGSMVESLDAMRSGGT